MKRFLSKKQKSSETKKPSVEKLLFSLFVITFTLMLVSQIGLANPKIRAFLTSENEMEGKPLGVEEYLYEEGEIGLKLLNHKDDNELKVLVNGEEAAAFSTSYIVLNVKNGDIIEIDGSECEDEALVQVVSKSENISDECINKSAKIKSGVKQLVDVRFK